MRPTMKWAWWMVVLLTHVCCQKSTSVPVISETSSVPRILDAPESRILEAPTSRISKVLYQIVASENNATSQPPEKLCKKEDSCRYKSDEVRDCKCDDHCFLFGDCCFDAPKMNLSRPRPTIGLKCVQTDSNSITVVNSCQAKFKGHPLVRDLCTRNIGYDPFVNIPVSSTKQFVTYRNIYCAICNNDQRRSFFWNISLSLHDDVERKIQNGNLSRMEAINSIAFNTETRYWGNWIPETDGKFSFYTVSFKAKFPTDIPYRTCFPTLRTDCPDTWDDQDIRRKCLSYLSPTVIDGIGFGNANCGLCHSLSLKNMSCFTKEDPPAVKPTAFHLDLNNMLSEEWMTPLNRTCDPTEIYDPFSKLCRNKLCGLPFYKFKNEKCSTGSILDGDGDAARFNEYMQKVSFFIDNSIEWTDSTDTDESLRFHQKFLDCPKIKVEAQNYVLYPNNTVVIPVYNNATYNHSFYHINGEGDLVICADVLNVEHPPEKFGRYPQYMTYLTLIGIGLSISCIVLHLIAFACVSEMRNLPGLNLASLSAVLLVAYSLFLFIDTKDAGRTSCSIIALFILYSFLSSFFWMNVLSFDVWRCLYMATTSLRFSGNQSKYKRFGLYSLYAYLLPLLITISAGLAEWHLDIAEEYRPGFGIYNCWFSQKKGLLLFFVGPFALLLLVNIIFYIFSARIILVNSRRTKQNDFFSQRRNFKLYLKLAIMMGLTWIFGILATIFNLNWLWVLFIVLNTSQGVFIFIAFTCSNSAVRRVFRESFTRKLGSFSSEPQSTDFTNSR